VADPAVLDRLVEHERQDHQDVGGRARGQPGSQLGEKRFDVVAADAGQGQPSEAGQDVQAQVAAVG
jgi:hypothetical protein